MPERLFVDGTGITPGTEGCKCGPACEFPCHHRVGIAPACTACGCAPFEEDKAQTPGAMEVEVDRQVPGGTIRFGYCHCGCGQKTPLSKRTRKELGHVRGEPLRYINGHNGVHCNIERADSAPYEVLEAGYETPCWIWRRHTTTQGYARLTVNGKREAGHRIYYERAKGAIPAGLELDHLCRNRACVNPDHLEPVTHAENIRRGRMGKLTTAQLRELYEAEGSDRELAERFGVSKSYVNRIRNGFVRAAYEEAA